MAEGVAHHLPLAVGEDPGAGQEGLQVERRVVEDQLGVGVGGQEHRKAVVDAVTVDEVGTDATPGPVGGFEQCNLAAGLLQPEGAGKPRKSRPDYHYICLAHRHRLSAGLLPSL